MSKLGEFVAAVDALELDAPAMADALWLAAHITEQQADPATSGRYAEHRIDAVAHHDPAVAAERAPERGVPVDVHRPAQAPSAAARGDRPVRLVAPRALAGWRTVLRELRPVTRRIPGRRESFDEVASAERSARIGRPWAVTGPRPGRERDAVLVLDLNSAMVVWSRLAEEARALLESAGFRTFTVRFMAERSDGALRLSTRPQQEPRQPLSDLRDPSGRRVVFVLSACLGDTWTRGTGAAQLAELAEFSPVVLLQPLPNFLWRRTGLDWERGRIASVIQARPSPLRVVAGTDPALHPIPVLELGPGWFGPWAQVLAGDRLSAVYPLLRAPSAHAQPPPLGRRQDDELGANPVERVRRFRAGSSPEAFRLAAGLAQFPLRLPIIRLVQRVLLPGSGSSVLAEVLAGGLILDAVPGLAPYGVPEDSRAFEFRPGVADVLRAAMPRSEVLRVRAAVSDHLCAHYDVPGVVFRATLSYSGAGEGFAYLSPEVLRMLAPHYAAEDTAVDVDAGERLIEAATAAVRSGDRAAAVSAHRIALAAVPVRHPSRISLLDTLSSLLATDSDSADALDEAIGVAKLAIGEAGTDDPARFAALGDILVQRYSRFGGLDHLADAARLLRAAYESADPADEGYARLVDRLAEATILRCLATEEAIFGWDAIDLYESALETTDSDERRRTIQLELAKAQLVTATVSAYPDAEVPEQVTALFLAATTESSATVTDPAFEIALRAAVAAAITAIGAGKLAPRHADSLVSILADSAVPVPAEVISQLRAARPSGAR
ncbi:SAV_2336 N-terminal domain-related protein [Nocardia sp. NPDC060249]|uniref:SAV_2336 N-terminal domain-related protein n=1 Tax=Nocardia sp. NPDC060249 TaxID=3347082 RepID=UPI003647C6FD